MSVKSLRFIIATVLILGVGWWWMHRQASDTMPASPSPAMTPQEPPAKPTPAPAPTVAKPKELTPAERIQGLTGFSPDYLWPFERERNEDAAVANIGYRDGLHVFDGHCRGAQIISLAAYGPYQGEITWESLESSPGSCNFRWCGMRGYLSANISPWEGSYPIIVAWNDRWKLRYDVRQDTFTEQGQESIPPIVKGLILKDMVWLNFQTFKKTVFRRFAKKYAKPNPDGTYRYSPAKPSRTDVFPQDFTTAFLHFEPAGPTVIRQRWEKSDVAVGMPRFPLDHLAYWYRPQPGKDIMNPADIEDYFLTRAEHVLGGIQEGKPRAWRIRYQFSPDLPQAPDQVIPEP